MGRREPPLSIRIGCPSCCAVGVDAAPPQGALFRTTGPVFGLAYPPPQIWALENPLLSIKICWPIMLCGWRRRCTSTDSPPQKNRPSFLPALPHRSKLGPREPLLSIRIGWPSMLCGRCRRWTSTGSYAQSNRPSFWLGLPSPPNLGPREPPMSIKIWWPIMLCGRRRRCTSTDSPA